MSRNWATAHFFGPLMVPWNCHGTSGYVIQLCLFRIKVWSTLTCLPSWTCLILIVSCCVLGLCHSFRSCALPSSLLFQEVLVRCDPAGGQLPLQSEVMEDKEQRDSRLKVHLGLFSRVLKWSQKLQWPLESGSSGGDRPGVFGTQKLLFHWRWNNAVFSFYAAEMIL